MSDNLQQLVDAQAQEIAHLKKQIAELKSVQSTLLAKLASVAESQSSPDALLSDFSAIKKAQSDLAELQSKQQSQLEQKIREARGAIQSELDDLKSFISSLAGDAAPPTPKTEPKPKSKVEEEPEPEPPSAPISSEPGVYNVPLSARRPLEGILNALSKSCGGNVHDRGLVAVTASGCLEEARFHAKNAADPAGNTVFASANKPNQWIAYDFKNKKLRLTGYSIRSRFDGFPGSNNLKSWVIEVSDDGKTWEVVDQKENDSDLNDKNIAKAWPIAKEVECSFVRLRQTDLSHSKKHYLAISGFELFGVLRD
jgi:gas vesicle protein